MEARRAADVSYGYGNGELKFRSRKRNGHVTVTNYGGRPEVRGDMLHLGICGTFHADGNVAVNILERGGGKYPTEVGIIFVRRELVPSSRDGE